MRWLETVYIKQRHEFSCTYDCFYLKELERRDEDFRRYTQDRNAKRREIIRKRKLANKFHHRHHN